MKRFLAFLLAVAAVASVAAAVPRIYHDASQGNRVALVANLTDVVEIADSRGLPAETVLAAFAEAGLGGVIASPDGLARLEATRGRILSAPGVPEWIPLLAGFEGQRIDQVQTLMGLVRAELDGGVRATMAVLAGPTVPGYSSAIVDSGPPASMLPLVDGLDEFDLTLGLVEDPSQLGYVPLPGTADLAALLDYSVIRVYRQPAPALYPPVRIIQKTTRSVKERSLRVVWVDLYKYAWDAPSDWMTGPEVDGRPSTGALAASLRYVTSTADALRATGFEVGRPPDRGPEPFSAGKAVLVLLILGPWAATLLFLLEALTTGEGSERAGRLDTAMSLIAAVLVSGLVVAGYGVALSIAPILSRQVAALWASIAYPVLALAWLARRWTFTPYGPAGAIAPGSGGGEGGGETVSPAGTALEPGPNRSGFPWLSQAGVVLTVAGLAALGGLAVAGFLSDTRFAAEIDYFRGVKLSYVIPPAVGFLAVLWFAYRTRAGITARDEARRPSGGAPAVGAGEPAARKTPGAGRFLAGGVRVWHVLAAVVALAVAVLYVGRSGDQPWLPVSGAEIAVRVWLDKVLYAQPRVKEFLVGYPALLAGCWLAWSGRTRWLPVFAALGGVGVVSIVNSFEHVRTPLTLTMTRTLNGAWLGLLVALVLVYIMHRVFGPLRAPGGSTPEGPPAGGRLPGGIRSCGRPPGLPVAGDRIPILGVDLDRLSFADATGRAIDLIRRAPEEKRAILIFTPNPEILARAGDNHAFRAILNSADLAVPDGVGVLWAARVLGRPLPERVSGFDLLVSILGRASEVWGQGRPLRVFLLGGKPGVAEEAGRRITGTYPGVEVAGEHHGYFGDDPAPLEAILRVRPDLLAVGMGSPRQETWLAENREALAGLVAIGVGGSFDVLSGRSRRAPAWVRSANLEWVYRIASEPRARLRRVPGLGRFVLKVLGSVARNRIDGRDGKGK